MDHLKVSKKAQFEQYIFKNVLKCDCKNGNIEKLFKKFKIVSVQVRYKFLFQNVGHILLFVYLSVIYKVILPTWLSQERYEIVKKYFNEQIKSVLLIFSLWMS